MLADDVTYKLKISVAYFFSVYVVSPAWSRQTEGPRIRRLNDVCNDMMVINVKNWKEPALNRKVWNDLVEKAKTYKGL